MVCPNCGRTLEVGEICSCQMLDVARRQDEINREKTEEKENEIIKNDRKIKEQSEKMQMASEKAEEAMDNAVNFGKYMIDCFKNMKKIDELFISRQDSTKSVILISIHFILTMILTFFVLKRTPISLAFSLASVFKTQTTTALITGAFAITLMPLLSKFGLFFYKAKDMCIYEIASEYIYTIPLTLIAIIATLINGIAGIIMLAPIFCFGTFWTCAALERNGMEKEKVMICMSIISTMWLGLAFLIIRIIS